MAAEKRSDDVGVLVKALDILDCLATEGPSPVLRLCERTGVTKPTAYRILKTFDNAGYVVRDEERREYALGPALYGLSRSARSSSDLVRVARPVMERLNDELEETINLGVVSHGEVVYLDTIESTQRLRSTVQLSLRDKLHCTALGKAFLAALSDAETHALLEASRREAMTPRTIVAMRPLLRQLAEIRQSGYAVDDEENELGSRCVAAAIMDSADYPIAAISLSAPTSRMPAAALSRTGQRIAAAAHEIGSLLS
jgi:IclR family acetate operon transcriptional repressor